MNAQDASPTFQKLCHPPRSQQIGIHLVRVLARAAHVGVPCLVGLAEDLDQVAAGMAVAISWYLLFLGPKSGLHVDIDRAIIDFQDDAGKRALVLGQLLALEVVTDQPVLEDRIHVDLGAMRSAITGAPGGDGRRREIADGAPTSSQDIRVRCYGCRSAP